MIIKNHDQACFSTKDNEYNFIPMNVECLRMLNSETTNANDRYVVVISAPQSIPYITYSKYSAQLH